MKNSVLVCVTRQKNCERLIKEGHRLSKENNCNMNVINVLLNDRKILDESNEANAIDYLFNVSKKYDGDISIIRSDNIVKTIVDFVKENKIGIIVFGESPDMNDENSIVNKVKNKVKKAKVVVVPGDVDVDLTAWKGYE